MIYVLLSSGFEGDPEKIEEIKFFFLIKIGYTSDDRTFSKKLTADEDIQVPRLCDYKSFNPTFKVLFKIPYGSKDCENRLHKFFSRFIYPEYGREWFVWNQEIIDFFRRNKTIDQIEEDLRKKRSNKKLDREVINGIIKNLIWIKKNVLGQDDVSEYTEKFIENTRNDSTITNIEDLYNFLLKKEEPRTINKLKIFRSYGSIKKEFLIKYYKTSSENRLDVLWEYYKKQGEESILGMIDLLPSTTKVYLKLFINNMRNFPKRGENKNGINKEELKKIEEFKEYIREEFKEGENLSHYKLERRLILGIRKIKFQVKSKMKILRECFEIEISEDRKYVLIKKKLPRNFLPSQNT